MPIPDYETLMGPLLRIAEANKGKEVSLPHAIEQLAGQFKLMEEEKRDLLPSGGAFKISSRVSWARTYLQKTGLLEATKRGYFIEWVTHNPADGRTGHTGKGKARAGSNPV